MTHPAAPVVVQQIRGDDLEIVVRGVGEGALAIAVPESPDTCRSGLQSVIDDDVATPQRTPALSRSRSSFTTFYGVRRS